MVRRRRRKKRYYDAVMACEVRYSYCMHVQVYTLLLIESKTENTKKKPQTEEIKGNSLARATSHHQLLKILSRNRSEA